MICCYTRVITSIVWHLRIGFWCVGNLFGCSMRKWTLPGALAFICPACLRVQFPYTYWQGIVCRWAMRNLWNRSDATHWINYVVAGRATSCKPSTRCCEDVAQTFRFSSRSKPWRRYSACIYIQTWRWNCWLDHTVAGGFEGAWRKS